MSEKKRSFSWLLLVGALLVAGGAGAYFYLQGNGRKLNPLDSGKVVPDDAMLTAYIDTDSPNWAKLQNFGSPEAQAAIAEGFESFQNGIFENDGLNYQEDLKPWVGDVTLVILPPSSHGAAASDPNSSTSEVESSQTASDSEANLLVIVGIKNPLKAWMFSRNLKSQPDVTTENFNYKGVSISATQVTEDAPTYSAVMGKYLVIAEQQSILEKAIDTYQGSTSLANSEKGSEILKKWTENENKIAQIYLPNSPLLSQQFQETVSGTSERTQGEEDFEGFKYAVITAGIDEAGMRVRAIAKVDPQAFSQPDPPAADALLLNRFPSETIALITGQELKSSWETVVKQTSGDPMIQGMFKGFKSSIKQSVDLDIEQDILSWMDAQFALGLISSNQGLLAQLGFGGALLFETSDRPLAEAGLKKINETLKKKLPVPLETDTSTYQNIEVTEWKIPLQDIVLGGYGWLEENLLFIALGQPTIEVMSETLSDPLQNSANFQTIAGSLPTPNQGYFYLDMDKVMTLLNRAPLPPGNEIPPEVLAVLNSIQGVGVTSSWPESEINQMDMLLALKPSQ